MASSDIPENSSFGARIFTFLALLSLPATLASATGTVMMALVALYGLVKVARGSLDSHLASAGWFLLAAYLAVVAVDFANGGTVPNNLSTAINYLPLLAAMPFGLAMRRLGVTGPTLTKLLRVTLACAVLLSMFQVLVLGVHRPGGLGLNSNPYGFAVSVWCVFLLARALYNDRERRLNLVFALAGMIPVVLTESRNVWACLFVGCGLVALLWAFDTGRWRELRRLAVFVGVPLTAIFLAVGYRRILSFIESGYILVVEGTRTASSLGERVELLDAGFQAFGERPILGVGLNERIEAVHRHVDPFGPDVSTLSHLHNDYLTHLVAFGVFGIVFIAAILVFVFVRSRLSADPAVRDAGTAATVMFAIYMLFDVVFNMDPMSSLLAIVVGIVLTSQRPGERQPSVDPVEAEAGRFRAGA